MTLFWPFPAILFGSIIKWTTHRCYFTEESVLEVATIPVRLRSSQLIMYYVLVARFWLRARNQAKFDQPRVKSTKHENHGVRATLGGKSTFQ
jgi:hypothetical protein